MRIRPVFEKEANDLVKDCYEKIKGALNLPKIPLFFAYFGAFPEYLEFISESLTNNLLDPKFVALNDEAGHRISSIVTDSLTFSESTQDWLKRYRQSLSFYNFQKDLSQIYKTNLKVAFIFIALREALKGWAVAAKQLPRTYESPPKARESVEADKFIYDDFNPETPPLEDKYMEKTFKQSSRELAKRETGALEVDLLPQFLQYARSDFSNALKKDEFWVLRVGVEKMILSYLSLFPHLIFSPINIVLKFTSKYDDFPDFIYLISEHFPTYAMHRMLFSAFMLKR